MSVGVAIVNMQDVENTARFYEAVLRFKPRLMANTSEGGYAEFGTGNADGVTLGFFRRPAKGADAATGQLRVVRESPEEVEPCYNAALGAGATSVTAPADAASTFPRPGRSRRVRCDVIESGTGSDAIGDGQGVRQWMRTTSIAAFSTA